MAVAEGLGGRKIIYREVWESLSDTVAYDTQHR